MIENLDFGFVEGTTPGKWVRRWHERHPEIPLVEHPLPTRDQLAALTERRVRLLLGRDLQRTETMHVIELYVEEMAVAAARDHVVAAFDAVTLADLEDETLLDPGELSTAGLLDVVASGAGVAVLPAPLARAVNNRDVVLRPVIDAEPTRIGVAWWADDEDPVIEEFIGVLRGRTASSSRQPLAGREPAEGPRRGAGGRTGGATGSGTSSTGWGGARASGSGGKGSGSGRGRQPGGRTSGRRGPRR
ncbi:LysR substrate-binding domain-containing protein [Tersicoccus sp. MR15.9]|uniref:LysR substrate-binding domain-containing protein n=1 Tax=Tersicoccus mangrovi TaxID=3121635 RepID=UPI002FE5FB25